MKKRNTSSTSTIKYSMTSDGQCLGRDLADDLLQDEASSVGCSMYTMYVHHANDGSNTNSAIQPPKLMLCCWLCWMLSLLDKSASPLLLHLLRLVQSGKRYACRAVLPQHENLEIFFSMFHHDLSLVVHRVACMY